jgi:hypothetical protein
MVHHGVMAKGKLVGGKLVAAVASGALAVGALSGAGSANATCLSISGLSWGSGCTSTPTSFAIGIGNAAIATANGLFNGAIAIGTGVGAESVGNFSLAYAGGSGSEARTYGTLNFAAVLGKNSTAWAGIKGDPYGDVGNTAINIGNADVRGNNIAQANGNGNLAVNMFGNGTTDHNSYVHAEGIASLATNMAALAPGAPGSVAPSLTVAGDGNVVVASGFLNAAHNIGGNNNNVTSIKYLDSTKSLVANFGGNLAFNAFGNGNTVTAGPGPFATAGNVARNNRTVKQATTGISINKP